MSTRRPTMTFGDDGTPACDVAWLWINNHTWLGWRLEVLTAHQPPVGQVLPHALTQPHAWQPARPRVPFQTGRFDEVMQLTAEADPRLALSRKTDLLVIGPRGPGLLKSLHLGSTADWLLLHPPAPMVIVRHGQRVQSIVACVDGSPHAARAIEALCALPWVNQTTVTVLAVDDGVVNVDAAMAGATTALLAAGASVQSHIDSGNPLEGIISQLDQIAPDLVVLGTRGLTGIARLKLGSTASAVTRIASCSVLVACADDSA